MKRHALVAILVGAQACGPTTSVETRPDPIPSPEPRIVGYLDADFEDHPEWVERGDTATPGGPVFNSVRGQIRQLRWSPRGDVVAAATNDHAIVLVDPRDGSFLAARRVHVRANAFTELGYFDQTGTRLMIDVHGHSDTGIVAVWDIANDRWVFERRSADRDAPSAVFVSDRVAYYEPRDQSVHFVVLDTGAETSVRVELSGEQRRLLDSDGRFVYVTNNEQVVVVDPTREEASEAITGRLSGVRPNGGLFAVIREDGSAALIDPADQAVKHEIPGPHARVFFTRDGLMVVDTGEDTLERAIVDPRTRETQGTGSFAATNRPALDDIGTVRFIHNNEDGSLQRQALGEEPAPFGELGYVLGASVAPDNNRILVGAGRALVMMTMDGEEMWRVENEMAGEASVWDIAPTETGLVTWGRAGSEHWSADGRVAFKCTGQGWPFVRENRPGWATMGAICVGEDEPYTPPNEGRVVGLVGERYAVLEGRALQLHELSNNRRRATYRLGRDAGEIYNGVFYTLGRGGVFMSWNGAWFVGRGAAQSINPRPNLVSPVGGNHFAAVNEQQVTVFDARRRKVLELEDIQAFDLSKDGTTLAYATEGRVFVTSLPSGDEVMRITPPEGAVTSVRLRGDSLALVHESESTIWHVPSVSQRVRFDSRAPFALNAAGTAVAVCEHARLTVRSTLDGTEQSIGECPLAEKVYFVANDRRVAVKSRTIVTLHRLDGEAMLTLRTLRASDGSHAIAYDGDKLWATPNAVQRVRWRDRGAITAPRSDASSRLDPDLLRRFFTD